MTSPRTRAVEARRERAERILDAAGQLLLRFGYRRVTIDDVASLAQIGKGTIYLHWKTRGELFRAVLLREAEGVVQGLLDEVTADPEVALPWRMMRSSFQLVLARPILRTVFVSGGELSGELSDTAEAIRASQAGAADDQYLQLLREHHVVRGDLEPEEVAYLLGSLARGFYAAEQDAELLPPVQRRADLLSDVVQRALGPSEPLSEPTVHALAQSVISMLQDVIAGHRAELRRAHETPVNAHSRHAES